MEPHYILGQLDGPFVRLPHPLPVDLRHHQQVGSRTCRAFCLSSS